tara:strand:+ start:168 stop:710 length:543 start_codon:yes stop_codon:yes gene_type:complete
MSKMSTKDEAIDQVEEAANQTWKDTATRAVKWRAKLGINFTSDQIWADIEGHVQPPREPRAMGAIMRKAVRDGLIVSTPNTVTSTKASNHKRPVRVWSPITEIVQKSCDGCGDMLPKELEYHQLHTVQESSVLCIECWGAWKEYHASMLKKNHQYREKFNESNELRIKIHRAETGAENGD